MGAFLRIRLSPKVWAPAVFASASWRGFALAFCLAMAACTAPYRHAELRPAGATFLGIDDAYHPPDGTTVSEVNVLLVHGMGTTNKDWIGTQVEPLSRALGFEWHADSLPQPEMLNNGGQLYRLKLANAGRRLNIFAVLWSPITWEAKRTLCYDVTGATPLCTDPSAWSKDKRPYVNALLKNQIMDDRMSDVTFYMNETGGNEIREAVQDAILRALSDEGITLNQLRAGSTPTAKLGPVFVISESLGSKIVVDSLQQLEDQHEAPDFAQEVRSHIQALFLLANQIPILNLGAKDVSGRADPYQHLKIFASQRAMRRKQNGMTESPLHVVAFSDPNDILSYQLDPDILPHEQAIVSNVVVSNDCIYLGFFENPDSAHTKYIQTTPVTNSIAHGSVTLNQSVGSLCAKQ
jgi:hypothetical protein